MFDTRTQLGQTTSQKLIEINKMTIKILVTGGSGLVGRAIETVLNTTEYKNVDEEWYFATSKEADLR